MIGYFIFKGIDSRKFGVTTKLPLPPVAERSMKTIEIPGRAVPFNRLDVMRKNVKLPITMSILDMSKLPEINEWLQGEGDLILSSDLTKRYHAYINQGITPEKLHVLYGKIPIVFTCEPLRYSVFNPMDTENPELDDDNLKYNTSVYVNGTAECEPLIHLKFAGKLQITVNGKLPFFVSTEGGEWSTEVFDSTASEKIYKYKCKEQEIYIDSMSRIAYTPTKNVVTLQTVGMFPVLKHGDNDISLELVSETIMFGQLKYKRCNQNLTVFGLQKNERWY